MKGFILVIGMIIVLFVDSTLIAPPEFVATFELKLLLLTVFPAPARIIAPPFPLDLLALNWLLVIVLLVEAR